MLLLIHFKPVQDRSKNSLVRIVERGKQTAQKTPQFANVELFIAALSAQFPQLTISEQRGNDVWITILGDDRFAYGIAQKVADAFFVELHRNV